MKDIKSPEEILKEDLNWSFDSDPGRFQLFTNLIKPAMLAYHSQFVEQAEGWREVNEKMKSVTENLRQQNLKLMKDNVQLMAENEAAMEINLTLAKEVRNLRGVSQEGPKQ